MTHYTRAPLVAEPRYSLSPTFHRPPPYRGGRASLVVGALVACGWLASTVLDPVTSTEEETNEAAEQGMAEAETETAADAAMQPENMVSKDLLETFAVTFLVPPPPPAPPLAAGPTEEAIEDPPPVAPEPPLEAPAAAEAASGLARNPVSPPVRAAEAPAADAAATQLGIDADSQTQIAQINLLGMNDRRTINRWIADNVVSITLSTSRGTFLAAVPAANAGTRTPYEDLVFTRPIGASADGETVRGSNMRLRFGGSVPLDRNRLDTALTLQVGGLQIEDLALHFTRTAAERILAAQAEVLAALPPPADGAPPLTPASLAIDICIINANPKIDRVTNRMTGDLLLAPDRCESGVP